MLATCAGAKAGASSISTRPPARSRYSVFLGSGVRQSPGLEASRMSCIERGLGAVAEASWLAACAADKATSNADDNRTHDHRRGFDTMESPWMTAQILA